MRHIPQFMLDAIPADITFIDKDGSVYVGRFDRDKVEFGNIEEQPIWSIRKIAKEETEQGVSYFATYPDGCTLYNYIWNEKLSLNYKFKN